MEWISKYWPMILALLSAYGGVYFSIRQTASNAITIKEHGEKITATEKKIIHIDSQLVALMTSNTRMEEDYKEIKSDIKEINQALKFITTSLTVISTTCNNRKGGC